MLRLICTLCTQVEEAPSKSENGNTEVEATELDIKEEQVSEAEVAFEDEDEEEEERLRRLEAGESIEDIDKTIQRQRQQSLHTTVLKVRTVRSLHETDNSTV